MKYKVSRNTIRTALLMSVVVMFVVGMQHYGQQVKAMPDVNQQLADGSNKIKDHAVLLIYSDGDWSGSILDSDYKSASQQGSGDTKIPFECKNKFFGLQKGIYSLAIQKGSEEGSLHLVVIRDGKLLKESSTTAAFGVVSFAGNC